MKKSIIYIIIPIYTIILLISCNDNFSEIEPIIKEYQELSCISKKGSEINKEIKEKYKNAFNQKDKNLLKSEASDFKDKQQFVYERLSELAAELAKYSKNLSNSENVKLSKLMIKEIQCIGWDEYIHNSQSNGDLKPTKNQNDVDKQTEDINERIRIEDFVKTFYESMELSKKEVEKLIETDDDSFIQSKINKLKNLSVYNTKERVKNLTGVYHDRYYIQLNSIDSISINDEQIKVYTTILYGLYEIGTFYNIERIDISAKNNGQLKITGWEDLKLSEMELKDYEGLENFSEKDFYNSIDYKW